ncbi:cbb3-type cytochrome oxidase assembly protein CcoS [Crocinitomix algicola]|uniref:cbb3-type cytochrome oxidase assembly protein CcoS n=1 Tax=Crocinitomix algicola TaxID=1740263 RepID=UPI000830C38B|nr:cbb3-type cytochrome oxidase assembly protein CcoS [Crocinitomix algicola]
MQIIVILIFVSLVLAGLFLGAFLWATKSGQFDDYQSPSVRILSEEETIENEITNYE